MENPPNNSNDSSFSDPETGVVYDAKTKTYFDEKNNAVHNVEYIEAYNMWMAAKEARREFADEISEESADSNERFQDIPILNGAFEINGKKYTINMNEDLEANVIYDPEDKDGTIFIYDKNVKPIGEIDIGENGKLKIVEESTDEESSTLWWANYEATITGNNIEVRYKYTKLDSGELEVTLKNNKKTRYKVDFPKEIKAEFYHEKQGGCHIILEGRSPSGEGLYEIIYILPNGKITSSKDDEELNNFYLYYDLSLKGTSIKIEKQIYQEE